MCNDETTRLSHHTIDDLLAFHSKIRDAKSVKGSEGTVSESFVLTFIGKGKGKKPQNKYPTCC